MPCSDGHDADHLDLSICFGAAFHCPKRNCALDGSEKGCIAAVDPLDQSTILHTGMKEAFRETDNRCIRALRQFHSDRYASSRDVAVEITYQSDEIPMAE